ncbi:MAG: recombinase family protein [Planctomycetes bacterium]|nr:recombinase family protein [Planctomycetota bacterium]
MSTEHQQYSTENQSKAIAQYAQQRGYEITTTYADGGKSGLTFEGRQSLRQLIQDVQEGRTPFKNVLVYDISRWGRFQDADESAYYEFICKRAGIDVHYCAEQFENDGSTQATIFKSVKRAMAGEYSRKLSGDVFLGQCNLIERGFRQGGTAGFGLRRMLIDQSGQPKGVLKRGEHKSLQTDRVILIPGPDEEVGLVRHIYEMFIKEGKVESEIAGHLNARNIKSESGRAWTRATVKEVLTNEKYIGNNVYNHISFKLKKKRVVNPPEMWIRSDGAFKAIVEPAWFFTAQGIIQERNRRFSNEEMIELLKGLVAKHTDVSAHLIDDTHGLPSSASYRSRFGSLFQAYQLAGYEPDRDFSYVQINRRIRQLYPNVMDDAVGRLKAVGASVAAPGAVGHLVVNGEYTAAIVISRCRQTLAGGSRWAVHFSGQHLPDITILVRMDPVNEQPCDFYLLPLHGIRVPSLRLADRNAAYVDAYRCETLDGFAQLALRAKIERRS